MPIMREGAQAEAPPFYSSPTKPITDGALIERLIGSEIFDACFEEAGAAMLGKQESYTLYASLVFNTAERAILTFYDSVNQPEGDEHWCPRSWRKKLPEDGGQLYRLAHEIMKWS